MTTTSVLLRNAEKPLSIGRMPSLTRKSSATVIMPRLLKPATICLGV